MQLYILIIVIEDINLLERFKAAQVLFHYNIQYTEINILKLEYDFYNKKNISFFSFFAINS